MTFPPARHTSLNRYSSHDAFSHDSIDSLGYDWERIADPNIAPKHPFKIYLPRSSADVVAAMRETQTLGQALSIRSMGHSSNDLVLVPGGSVLCTERINYLETASDTEEWTIRDSGGAIVPQRDNLKGAIELTVPAPPGAVLAVIDTTEMTIRLPGGAVLADVDQYLLRIDPAGLGLDIPGLGLPIIGDNNHITVGGFTSVGGISPASHRFGLFVDNIVELEYVDRAGETHVCTAKSKPKHFHSVLTGLGKHGVITAVTCRLEAVQKSMIIENKRRRIRDVGDFIEFSRARLSNPKPDDYLFHRGMWIDFVLGDRNLLIGQFSSYVETPQSPLKTLRKKLAYGYLHFLGKWAGRLPEKLTFVERIFRLLGILGIVVFPPRYGSVKDAESFTDRVIDYSEGEPWRMLTLFAPVGNYQPMFTAIYDLCKTERKNSGILTNISIYVKPVHSTYLANKVKKVSTNSSGETSGHFVELTFLLFMDDKLFADPEKVDRMKQVFDRIVSTVDQLCVANRAYRYMPTKTSKDPALVRKINPNHYA